MEEPSTSARGPRRYLVVFAVGLVVLALNDKQHRVRSPVTRGRTRSYVKKARDDSYLPLSPSAGGPKAHSLSTPTKPDVSEKNDLSGETPSKDPTEATQTSSDTKVGDSTKENLTGSPKKPIDTQRSKENVKPANSDGIEHNNSQETQPENDTASSTSSLKFYIIPTPELTDDLLKTYSLLASNYYERALNEEMAEIWLHRGFQQLTPQDGLTTDPEEADVFLIFGYMHMYAGLQKILSNNGDDVDLEAFYLKFLERVVDKTKPHVMFVPSYNAAISKRAWISQWAERLQHDGVNLWSTAFERNPHWQGIKDLSKIIPVPYVVKPSLPRDELLERTTGSRTKDFVFYAGDARANANKWAGCDRSMVLPLVGHDNMDVRLVSKTNRLSQETYNSRMFTSEYCLVLCGDTPSSRSLTSSMVAGCIPVRVGSRLRGLCEPPCHPGFGWTVSGISHLPYADIIDWESFPEVSEQQFVDNPSATLDEMFARTGTKVKAKIRSVMDDTRLGWIYGWGDPVYSTDFGEAASYVWRSIARKVPIM